MTEPRLDLISKITLKTIYGGLFCLFFGRVYVNKAEWKEFSKETPHKWQLSQTAVSGNTYCICMRQ